MKVVPRTVEVDEQGGLERLRNSMKELQEEFVIYRREKGENER